MRVARTFPRALLHVTTAIAALLGVIATGLVYLQTEHGFRTVILPAATRFIPGEFHAEGGRLSLFGESEVRGFSYRFEGQGALRVLDLAGERLQVRISPMSFLTGGVPVVESVSLESGRLYLDLPRKDEAATPHEEPGAEPRRTIPLPVRIGEIALRDASVIVHRGEQREVRVSDGTLLIRGAAPGGEAEAELVLTYEIVTPNQPEGFRGQAKLGGALRFDEALWPVGWEIEVDEWRRIGRDGVIDAHVSGSLLDGLRLAVDLTSSIRGVEDARFRGHYAQIRRGEVLEHRGHVELSLLDMETLNPPLALISDDQFFGGAAVGTIEFEIEGDRIDAEIVVKGTDWVLDIAKLEEFTQPISFATHQKFEWVPGEFLNLDKLEFVLDRAGTRLIELSLTEPIRLLSKGAEEMKGEGTSELHARIQGLDLATIDKVLRVAGQDPLPWFEDGVVEGDLKLNADVEVRRVEVASTLKLSKLHVEGIPEILGAEAQLSLALDFSDAGPPNAPDPSPFDYLAMQAQFEMDLTSSDRGVSATRIRGHYAQKRRGESSEHRGRVELSVADMKALNPAVALILDDRFSTGSGTGSVEFEIEGDHVKADIDLKGTDWIVYVAELREPTEPISFTTHQKFEWIRGEMLHLDALEFVLDRGGTRTIELSLTEPIRLVKNGQGEVKGQGVSELHARLRGVDLVLVNEVMRVSGRESIAQIEAGVIDGDLKLRADAEARHLDAEGTLDLSKLRVNGLPGRLDATVALSLGLDVGDEGSLDGSGSMNAHLWRRDGDGPVDHLELQAQANTSPRHHLVAQGQIEYLDLDPYLALYQSIEKPPKTEAKEEKESLDLDLDLALTFEEVVWREVRATDGRATLHHVEGVSTLELAPTNVFDGGSLEARVERGSEAAPSFEWEVKGAGIDLGKISRSVQQIEKDARYEGILAFDSKGAGRAAQRSALLKNTQGELTLSARNVRMRQTGFTVILAEATGIDALRISLLKRIDGRAHIENGLLQVTRLEGSGNLMGLIARGNLGPDGEVDAVVDPRIGPGLVNRPILGKIPLVSETLGLVDGLLVLPIIIEVKGPITDLKFTTRTRAGNTMDRLAVGEDEKAIPKREGAVKTFFKGVFGGKKSE